MDNLLNILRQTSINAIIAMGMTFVILTAGIDLSVGSILAFAGAVCASMIAADNIEEPASEVGDLEIVLHFDGTPALLTRVTSSIVMPFNAVSAEYAAIEGEGDGSLEYWREAHWEFFSRECERIGLEPRVDMPVSCMTFELVEVIAEPRQR